MTRILVVEDDADMRNLLSKLFPKQTYAVITADTGKKAMRVIKSEKPEIVLLDIRLPDVDGVEVLREIRSISKLIAVIVITGYETPEVKEETERLGVNRFITKPFNLTKFMLMVKDVAYEFNKDKMRRDLRVRHRGGCRYGSCILCGREDCPYS